MSRMDIVYYQILPLLQDQEFSVKSSFLSSVETRANIIEFLQGSDIEKIAELIVNTSTNEQIMKNIFALYPLSKDLISGLLSIEGIEREKAVRIKILVLDNIIEKYLLLKNLDDSYRHEYNRWVKIRNELDEILTNKKIIELGKELNDINAKLSTIEMQCDRTRNLLNDQKSEQQIKQLEAEIEYLSRNKIKIEGINRSSGKMKKVDINSLLEDLSRNFTNSRS
jgi:hypothetical protein